MLPETAIHEAGHVIAAYHFHCGVADDINLERVDHTVAHVASDPEDWSCPEEAFVKLVELLAVYRAQMRVAPLGRCLRDADRDLSTALRILQLAFAEDSRLTTFFKARRETDAILTSRWELVLGIAGLLLEHQSLDAETAEMWLDYASESEGVDAAAVSNYFAIRAVASGEDLDRDSVPPPDDVVSRWKHYVDIGRSIARAGMRT